MTAISESALSNLIFLLKSKGGAFELGDLVQRLEFLQQILRMQSARADQPSIDRYVKDVCDQFNDLRMRQIWGSTPEENRVYQEFLDQMKIQPELQNAHARAAINAMRSVSEFSKEHPTLTKVAGGAALVGGSAVILPAILVGGLNILGFSAIGPVAGSIAAGMQGPAVAAGSAFALAQAATMGGIVVASGVELVAGVAAATAGVGLLARTTGTSNTSTEGGSTSGNPSNDPGTSYNEKPMEQSGEVEKRLTVANISNAAEVPLPMSSPTKLVSLL